MSSYPESIYVLDSKLVAQGLTLASVDDARYVGTILWREAVKNETFTNLDGLGYWIPHLAYPEGGHKPK